jgi:galactonate dehydratase
MKITGIETFLIAPRWLFCKVSTDEGVSGWGEPVVEGRAATTRTAVHELAGVLIGADPLRIEDCWQTMTKGTFYRGGPVLSSAVAGIDQALWDIAGKVRGAPVHELLGGPVRDRVRVYSWVGGDEPDALAEGIAAQIEAGFTAIKMNGTGSFPRLASKAEVAKVIDRVSHARELLGEERDLAVDFHGRVSVADAARIIPQLEPFQPVLNSGIAVVQPDISHAGGISEVRRIAVLAETFDAALAPHCPLGPIALAASLQVAFATPNFLIQEQSLGMHYNVANDLLDYLVDRSVFAFVDGHVGRPTGPGLGIEIDEAAVRRADQLGHDWHPPVWRHDDGSYAEW